MPAATDESATDASATDASATDASATDGTARIGAAGPSARGESGVGVAFDGWGWRYADRDAWAVRGVDLRVEAGERVAIVGPSGAGKSTLLRAVAGVLPDDEDEGTGTATEGTLTVGGSLPRDARGTVGLVMQDPEAHTVMSRIGDDVAFGCENAGVPRDEIRPRVRAALETVGLHLPRGHSTAELSGGQRQRLALAGVLAMRPGVLVLDEPCANLDPDGVRQVHDAVAAVLDETGETLLVVEHRIGTWLDLVDRLVVLEAGGGVFADGPPDAVLAERAADLERAGIWTPTTAIATGSARTPAEPADDGAPGDVHPRGEVLLRARDLTTARGDGRDRVVIGEGLDVDVRTGSGRRGGVLAITGPNGVGKSTLGLTLAGLLAPAGGDLTATDALRRTEPHERHERAGVVGPAPAAWSSRDLARRIGTVFQDPAHQFVAQTVRAEVAAGARATGADDAETDRRVDELLDAFALTDLADANPFTLSGGEQRRLAIAGAMAARPRVLVLDEPTSGQDLATWHRVADRLGALADAGTAVVAVTHDEDLVRALDAEVLDLRTSPRAPEADGTGAGDTGTVLADPASRTPLAARIQPVAGLLGVLAIAAALVTSLDVVTGAVAVVLELALLPFLRVPIRTLALRASPVLVAAPLAGLSIALYGEGSGRTWFDLGFAHVTDGSLVLAAATALRLLGIALPVVALFARVDPTDLADGLAQILRLPARFVLGALAAVRLMTLMRADWRHLGMARRARGTADSGRLRRGVSMGFALLVLALRRATTLATAMESRGFGARGPRTWAREARFGRRDWCLLLVCVTVGVVAVATAVVMGTWRA